MADHYYALDKGHGLDPSAVVTGVAATPAKHIELRLLDGAGLTRMDVVNALTTLKAFFSESVAVTP